MLLNARQKFQFRFKIDLRILVLFLGSSHKFSPFCSVINDSFVKKCSEQQTKLLSVFPLHSSALLFFYCKLFSLKIFNKLFKCLKQIHMRLVKQDIISVSLIFGWLLLKIVFMLDICPLCILVDVWVCLHLLFEFFNL